MALLQWPSSSSPPPAVPALKSSQCSVMRPSIGPCRRDQGCYFRAQRSQWQLFFGLLCVLQLLFSRRRGQDALLQALSRLIRRRRPCAVWASSPMVPPADGSAERQRMEWMVYYIWPRSAVCSLVPFHGAASVVCAFLLPSVPFLCRLCLFCRLRFSLLGLLCWHHDATLNQQTMKR